jgi:hypothetical protein
MQFSPVWSPQRFRTFWSAGTGWGVFAQELQNGKLSIQLDVHGGSICLKRLDLTWPDGTPPASVRIEASTTESCSASIAGRSLSVNWADGTRLNAGLSLSLAFASTAP